MLGQVDITFLPKLNHTTNFKAHSLISALDEIAGDKYASEINRLRLLNLDEYKEQKKKLPAFCFNGTFNPSSSLFYEKWSIFTRYKA